MPNDRPYSRRGSELQHETKASSRRRVQWFVGWPNKPFVAQTTHEQKVIPGAIQEPSEPLSALNRKSLSLVKSNGDLV
jgi:hypothetical protein